MDFPWKTGGSLSLAARSSLVGEAGSFACAEVESASAFAREAMNHLDPDGDAHASVEVTFDARPRTPAPRFAPPSWPAPPPA